MSYIITPDYFVREYEIPGLDEPDNKVYPKVEMFIDEYCRVIMSGVLTIDLLADFESYLEDGILPDTAPEKWTNLIYGCNYTVDDVEYKWGGIVQQFGTFKKSLLVPYVYYHWLENEVSYVSGVGEVKAEAKNATTVNSTQRLTKAWNDFVQHYMGKYEENFFSSYSLGWSFDYYPQDAYKERDVSLLKFLSDNPTDYPNISPCTYEIKNQLGF